MKERNFMSGEILYNTPLISEEEAMMLPKEAEDNNQSEMSLEELDKLQNDAEDCGILLPTHLNVNINQHTKNGIYPMF